MHQFPTPQPILTRPQPSMADLWSELPADPGMLVDAVREQLQAHAPLVPVLAPGFADEPQVRLLPYRDRMEWLLVKHAVQAALVASVVMFAIYGGRAPLMALGYVGTGLLLMLVVVLADRFRFVDRDPGLEIVQVVVPTAAPPQPVTVPSTLGPMVEQMHVALAQPVSVT